MKITFNSSFAVIRAFGFLELHTPHYLLDDESVKLVRARGVSHLLLSFKDVVFFAPAWLNQAIVRLKELSKELKVEVGICDYSIALHDIMMKTSFSKSINFSLFETEDIARIFLDRTLVDTKGSVLLFVESQEHREDLQKRLQERNYKVQISKNRTLFSNQKKRYKYAITARTHLVEKPSLLQTFIKDNSVIYKTNGIIDSSFIEIFNMDYHKNMLKVGFKLFIFWINTTINVHGANFLIRLAQYSAKYGAILIICGVNEKNLSPNLVEGLKQTNVLLYKNLQEFLDDNGTVYVPKDAFSYQPRHISKGIVEILPFIIECATNSVSALLGNEILSVRMKVSACDLRVNNDLLTACIVFYGDFDMRLVVALKREKLEQMSKIFVGVNDKFDPILSGYEKLLSIIANKILAFFISKDMNVGVSMSKFFIDDRFYDDVSNGALIELGIKEDDNLGVLFISK
ncbi:hypothetical protein [Campylobacter sp. 7477a]|uniref:hypothetical protein n=1 Tax=Campylobacter sp. 7477a TaxID=2735741 RepID=UPI0030155CD1|nr:hypothetical protein [Campylobacter sp. 7477a]